MSKDTDFRAVADGLRSRVDLFGKTLAAIASLGTGAVGLSKIGDLFPHAGNTGWVFAACAGLVAAATAALVVAVRLMGVAKPVFMAADLDGESDLSTEEKALVRPVFAAVAGRYGYRSLVGLQERERGLRRAATWCDDEDERARRTARADEVEAAVEEAMARGMVVTVRRRATRAVADGGAFAAYLVVVLGLLAFALGTDKVSSDRIDLVAQAKACGEARGATATKGELGRSAVFDGKTQVAGCDAEPKAAEPKAAAPAKLTRAQARAKVATELGTLWQACTALVASKTGDLREGDCDAIEAALRGR